MTVNDIRHTSAVAVRGDDALTVAALAGLALSVWLRVQLAGAQGAASVRAGACFGAVLICLAVLLGLRLPRPTGRALGLGLLAAVSLCLAPGLHSLDRSQHVAVWAGFGKWAVVVTLVAVAEELLLRGALFDICHRAHGPAYAVVVSAIAFGLLHVPVYGAHVLPLDVAVGLVLGGLRLIAGSVWAPAAAHTAADLVGWWLR